MKKRYIPIQIDTFSNSIFHKKENKEYQTTLGMKK